MTKEIVESNQSVTTQYQPVSESTAMIQVIERAAMNPDVDMDKMERLLQMQERISERNAAMAFSADIAEMQSCLPTIAENGEIKVNGIVRSKYAKFEDINDSVKPVLQRYGFAITFRTSYPDAGTVEVTGVLSHRHGHREETSMRLPVDNSGSKNSVQAIGSSVSYGKRYVMCALLNITSRGEDDDGQAGGTQFITGKQVNTLADLLEKSNANKEDFLRKYMFVESLEDITQADYPRALNGLKAKIKQNEEAAKEQDGENP